MTKLTLLINHLRILVPAVLLVTTSTGNAQSLENLFKNPPINARPYVWWHWMGSNFSKSGITKDLEAMKAQGIGGATIFNITSAVQESHAPTLNNPWPEQSYRSTAYWDAIRFAAAEAKRLGLEIGLHNTAGYSTTGGPWIDEERGMKRLVWRRQTVRRGDATPIRIDKPEPVTSNGWGSRVLPPVLSSFYKDIAYLAIELKDSLRFEQPHDFTANFDVSGNQITKLPEGDWIIYRLGYAATMSIPHPLPDEIIGRSFEADKMSREQSIYHWEQVIDPVKKHLGEYFGTSFKHMLIDSYEAAYQNWTPDFRSEFIDRKGYDPLPWILTFADVITKEYKQGLATETKRIRFDLQQTKRFEWDYKDVINQLYFENGWIPAKKALQDVGLQLQWEPYGGPFDTIEGAALADLPMAEFWADGNGSVNANVPAAGGGAARAIVGAEAFTGRPGTSQYTEDPAALKKSAVGAFASGVNRLILHHWVHQPFDDKFQPGMGMGWWGTHFGRYQTWAESGKAFFAFLTRSQAMLQYGQKVVDYLCVEQLQGNADLISKNDFLKQDIQVINGKVRVASGRIYRFLVLPNSPTMLPEMARKIKNLVEQGATIVATRPQSSPSLNNFPGCDEELKAISNTLWDAASQGQKGVVLPSLTAALTRLSIQPDFKIEIADSTGLIKYVHRSGEDGEIYYVANVHQQSQQVLVSFRQNGLQPELWQAETGTAGPALVWEQKNGRTFVWLNLADNQSVFVIFRKPPVISDHAISFKTSRSNSPLIVPAANGGNRFITSKTSATVRVDYASGKTKTIRFNEPLVTQVNGPWRVRMQPKLEPSFSLEMSNLRDFSTEAEKRVKYFSGTAIYKKSVVIQLASISPRKQVLLDLGTLNDIVSVTVNGKNLGVIWYPPYQVDISDAIKSGVNHLEIAVTNNWVNRLIGDEQEPADFEWGTDREVKGRAIKAYPDWFLKGEPRPSSGRKTFSIWYYYRNNSKLVPAGLVGPVKLTTREKASF